MKKTWGLFTCKLQKDIVKPRDSTWSKIFLHGRDLWINLDIVIEHLNHGQMGPVKVMCRVQTRIRVRILYT